MKVASKARGHQRHAGSEVRRIVIGFDAETFEQVRSRAVAAGHSFAEEARQLIEFGLEDVAHG